MARLPKCAGCIHWHILTVKCSVYPQGIPNDIFLEFRECDKYELEPNTEYDESLPIAKGR